MAATQQSVLLCLGHRVRLCFDDFTRFDSMAEGFTISVTYSCCSGLCENEQLGNLVGYPAIKINGFDVFRGKRDFQFLIITRICYPHVLSKCENDCDIKLYECVLWLVSSINTFNSPKEYDWFEIQYLIIINHTERLFVSLYIYFKADSFSLVIHVYIW